MSNAVDLNEALALKPLELVLNLTPRIARRLRALAYNEQHSASSVATTLLTRALVPDARDRKRLRDRDIDDVRDDDRHRVEPVEERESA